jgi:phosphatidate cytidylyltransferase
LALRVYSALVLVPLAIAIAYVGGWPFAVFWGAAALGVLWEWTSLVVGADRRSVLTTGAASIVLTLALIVTGYPLAAVIVLTIGTLGTAALAPAARRKWVAGGLPYAAAVGMAPIILRSEGQDGFLAIILLFAIVWTTDIVAYFVGRAVGGPKLMPQISPKKTWSGAFGGIIGAVLMAIGFAKGLALPSLFPIAMLAVLLSVVAQAGDLFESFLKRRFGAKDSGHIIPGHGGLMDRLDGFVTAAALAALIGVTRGEIETAGRGFLVW